jgi:hypothetical protein
MKQIIPPPLLFEFVLEVPQRPAATSGNSATPSKKAKKKPKESTGLEAGFDRLDDRFLLPDFSHLNDKKAYGRVKLAWSVDGLTFECKVRGKKSPPQFVQDKGGFSDGLRVWIDTRNSPNVHRATRYCHCFHFFPTGKTQSSGVPHRCRGILDEVARAREQPNTIQPSDLQVECHSQADGYDLVIFIPGSCLTGYQPQDFDRLRIYYDIVDAELGTQSQAWTPELRYAEDPSLWMEARLQTYATHQKKR